ncbi:MAG: RNA 3'-terminal phosphate cyclase [Candidatus Helarchaeota archaeon]|nr:RNA 3'-terminal phosphate cyclase [Candidatus Helarchaeota archaeon]
MTNTLLEIDGSFGEGGGSILRLACALSVLTKKPVKIFNIRKNRPKPGLKPQHLVGLQALTEISNGILENGKIGAIEITFTPNEITQGTYTIRIGTAGSVGLILQILQLACIHASGNIGLRIEGGATFGLWAPTLPYLEHVTIPRLAMMGYNIKVNLKRHGFYPKGGARVDFEISPVSKLKPIALTEFGKVTEIGGVSIATFHLKNRKVAERQAEAAQRVISRSLGIKPVIHKNYVDALNPGSGICLWLKTDSGIILGSDIIGEKRKPSEKIGTECARYLCEITRVKATVDKFLSDQIIPFMALAQGTSIIKPHELTNHTKTNIWLIEKFLEKKFLINQINLRHEIKIETL